MKNSDFLFISWLFCKFFYLLICLKLKHKLLTSIHDIHQKYILMFDQWVPHIQICLQILICCSCHPKALFRYQLCSKGNRLEEKIITFKIWFWCLENLCTFHGNYFVGNRKYFVRERFELSIGMVYIYFHEKYIFLS